MDVNSLELVLKDIEDDQKKASIIAEKNIKALHNSLKSKLDKELDNIFNTDALKQKNDDSFKFKIEKLEKQDELDKIKWSFGFVNNNSAGSNLKTNLIENCSIFEAEYFKITETQPENDKKGNDILLLHGTKGINLKGILEKGFIPSQSGTKGPGVYLTNNLETTRRYARCFCTNNSGCVNEEYFIFVCRVKCGKFVSNHDLNDYDNITTYNSRGIFTNIPPKEFQSNYRSSIEINGAKIIKGKFCDVDPVISIAHESLVKPEFLVRVTNKDSTSEIVKRWVYDKSNKLKSKHSIKILSTGSFKARILALIDNNLKAELQYLSSLADTKVKSVKAQMTLEYKSIIKSCKKYNITKIENGKDYALLTNALKVKNSDCHIKLNYYKIKKRKTKKGRKNFGELLLHGVQIDNLQKVLVDGYSDKVWSMKTPCFTICKDYCESITCARKASNQFDNEYEKGLSYNKNGEKNISFIFIVVKKKGVKDFGSTFCDSEGNFILSGSFHNFMHTTCEDVFELVPAYLVVVEK